MNFSDVKSIIIDEIPGYAFRRLQAHLCELQRQYEFTEAYLKAKYADKSTLVKGCFYVNFCELNYSITY